MAVYKDNKHNCWFFRAYYTDMYGKRKQKYKTGFPTRKMAKEFELDFIMKPFNNNITFNDLYANYIKHVELNMKPNSIRSLKSRFSNHILPYFGNMLISRINSNIYNDWKIHILEKGMSFKYNCNLHTCMVIIMNYAIKFFDLEKNIPSLCGNFKQYETKPKINFWNYDQFKTFISVVDDIEYYSLFHVLYFTGMRIGELLALNWNDIHDDYIDINKSISKEKVNGQYIITNPKSFSSIRHIKIDLKTHEVLNTLYDYYRNFVNFNDEWFVFGGINPKAQTTITRYKNGYCNKSGVRQIKIHDFRHSHASLLISKGTPLTVVSKRLGHKDLTTTLNIYAHLLPEDEDKAVLTLNQLN